MVQNNKIAICLLTNENRHLEEWLKHHRNYGFSNFLIYCDDFQYIEHKARYTQKAYFHLVKSTNNPRFQMDIYEQCCKKYKNDYEFILFLDSDEYYESKTGDIQKDVKLIKERFGELTVYH